MNTPPRWPVFLIALPAAVSVWAGWVGLGQLCGFGLIHPLPGVTVFGLDKFQLNTAITLPIGVEAYGSYALGAWLSPDVPDAARKFARWSAIGSLLLGMLGQVSFHLLSAAHAARAPWPVVVLVASLPVVVLGFGAALSHLLLIRAVPAEQAAAKPVTVPELDAVMTPERPSMLAAWPRPALSAPKAAETATATAIAPATPMAKAIANARPAMTTRQGHRDRRAAAIVAKNPGITGRELGMKLGVSERTGRRVLAGPLTGAVEAPASTR